MKRLLILISNLSVGGAQKMVCELVDKLDKKRYQPIIFCLSKKSGTYIEEALEKIAEVEYFGMEGKVKFKSLMNLIKRITAVKPDVIHAHMGGVLYAIFWSLLHNKKIAATIHTRPDCFYERNKKLLNIAIKLKKIILVAVSKKNYIACKQFFDDDICMFINNGIAIDSFCKKEHEQFTFINVATHNQNKNQSMILRCFKRFSDIYDDSRLLLLGDGPEHKNLIALAEKLGISDRVEFAGSVHNTEDYYAVSDVYLQSSHSEAMPLSILEALATGLPILSTDVGGIKDVVKENGILVSDNDEEAFFEGMKTLYEANEEAKKKMSEISLSIVKEYSSEKMALEYMDFYDSLN